MPHDDQNLDPCGSRFAASAPQTRQLCRDEPGDRFLVGDVVQISAAIGRCRAMPRRRRRWHGDWAGSASQAIGKPATLGPMLTAIGRHGKHRRGGRRGQRSHHFAHRGKPPGRVLFQRPGHHAAIGLGEFRYVGLGREVLHEHFAHAFAVERHAAGEQLIEDRAQGVDVEFLAVAAVGHLRRHVVYGADAFRVPAATAARDELRKAVVAHLHDAFVAEDIARLQVAVDDAVVVQIGHAGRDAMEPDQGLLRGASPGDDRPARPPGTCPTCTPSPPRYRRCRPGGCRRGSADWGA